MALHEAYSRNDVATARLLLEAGANANAKNNFGTTPLSVANLPTLQYFLCSHSFLFLFLF
jgi:ankyrin repeat protein